MCNFIKGIFSQMTVNETEILAPTTVGLNSYASERDSGAACGQQRDKT
jgi:hypothetical protein